MDLATQRLRDNFFTWVKAPETDADAKRKMKSALKYQYNTDLLGMKHPDTGKTPYEHAIANDRRDTLQTLLDNDFDESRKAEMKARLKAEEKRGLAEVTVKKGIPSDVAKHGILPFLGGLGRRRKTRARKTRRRATRRRR